MRPSLAEFPAGSRCPEQEPYSRLPGLPGEGLCFGRFFVDQGIKIAPLGKARSRAPDTRGALGGG